METIIKAWKVKSIKIAKQYNNICWKEIKQKRYSLEKAEIVAHVLQNEEGNFNIPDYSKRQVWWMLFYFWNESSQAMPRAKVIQTIASFGIYSIKRMFLFPMNLRLPGNTGNCSNRKHKKLYLTQMASSLQLRQVELALKILVRFFLRSQPLWIKYFVLPALSKLSTAISVYASK